MFQEDIADWTATHLRTHIEAYLDEVNGRFSIPATLVLPKSIESTSVVGGLISSYNEILPQYGIDCADKEFSEAIGDLYTYQYTGQINGMLHGTSRQAVDTAIKRHGAAVELFIKRHQFLHEYVTDDFSFLELAMGTVSFSGAEDLGVVDGRQLWLAAFSIDVAWFTSEAGPGQHAT